MKKVLLWGCACCAAGFLGAVETALGGFGGSLEFPGPELLFQPCYKPNNWTTRFSLEDDFNAPAKGAHAFYFMPDADKPKERVFGSATFKPTSDGGVEAVWSLGKGDSSTRATVCTDFRLPQYEGALLETDAGSIALTETAASRRLLLTHLTDVQNSGIRYADAGKRILLAWGKGPYLMRAGRAAVSLACAEGAWQVWALSPTGRRVREVAATSRDGRLTFTADVAADLANASYLYELVAR